MQNTIFTTEQKLDFIASAETAPVSANSKSKKVSKASLNKLRNANSAQLELVREDNKRISAIVNKVDEKQRLTAGQFDELIKGVESMDNDSILTYCNITVFGILNKIIESIMKSDSNNNSKLKRINALKADIVRTGNNLNRAENLINDSRNYIVNSNGELKIAVDSDKVKKAVYLLSEIANCDGMELVNECCLALFEEHEKAVEDNRLESWLTAPYTVKKANKRHAIKNDERIIFDGKNYLKANSENLVETVVVPFKEINRRVRSYIYNNKYFKIDGEYVHVEDFIYDDETGLTYELDRRLRKRFSPVGNYLPDELFNMEKTIETLKLSNNETVVLNYRLQGYGKESISTAMKISKGNVSNYLNRIRNKAEKAGLKPLVEVKETAPVSVESLVEDNHGTTSLYASYTSLEYVYFRNESEIASGQLFKYAKGGQIKDRFNYACIPFKKVESYKAGQVIIHRFTDYSKPLKTGRVYSVEWIVSRIWTGTDSKQLAPKKAVRIIVPEKTAYNKELAIEYARKHARKHARKAERKAIRKGLKNTARAVEK